MSRYSASFSTSRQVKVGLTKLYAIMCASNDGGQYGLYDVDAPYSGNPPAPIVAGAITPAAGTELLFKGMTFTKGLYINFPPGHTTVLTVIYE